VDIERYLRWLQDVRRYQPSTVSRRLSVVVGFYRVCVIDQILPHSPADYVRRPTVPADSPTLGLGHLQFEALITTARLSTNPNDYALVALLGLLGLRIFEACGASIADLGEEHGHRVLRVRGKGGEGGKGGKVVLVPLPPAVGRAIDRAVDGHTDGPILHNTLGARMDRHAATRRLKHLAATADVRMPRMHLTAARDFADDGLSRSMTYLARMTTSRKDDLAEGLLLVAIVEMTHGHAAAGQRYEDAVLALLDRHGGSVERRLRRTDSATEVHLIRFRSRAGYESFMADPDRLAYRAEFGDAVPNTRVLEVREV
jgi:integrase